LTELLFGVALFIEHEVVVPGHVKTVKVKLFAE